MKFFIDYENVHGQGLRGVEFLKPDDEVVLFYSNVCMKIENGDKRKRFVECVERTDDVNNIGCVDQYKDL